MRRMTLGKPDAVKPLVRFDEGRGWGRKLTTAVRLTPLSPASPTLLKDSPPAAYAVNSLCQVPKPHCGKAKDADRACTRGPA